VPLVDTVLAPQLTKLILEALEDSATLDGRGLKAEAAGGQAEGKIRGAGVGVGIDEGCARKPKTVAGPMAEDCRVEAVRAFLVGEEGLLLANVTGLLVVDVF